MDNIDLKYIKKHYGENFAKLCRELFPTILETPGLLSKIISERFDPSPTLYEDVLKVKNDFKTFIFSFYVTENKKKSPSAKTAEELLDEAGYVLYPECQTEKDIQSFKKYYDRRELLCTFGGGRLDSCRVWFAVKKNVDKIRRKDFDDPQREDEYGTSVISIQFTRGLNSTVSIKNRYNHMVSNPDATFGNNLDNIIIGLTDAFCNEYGIDLSDNFKHKFDLEDYVMADDDKLYKTNVVNADQVSYCVNNIIIDRYGKIKTYDKSKYLLIEHYLLDLVHKKIKNLIDYRKDGFVESIGEIKSIHISLDQNKNRVINITPTTGEDVQIVLNKSNQMIEYTNKNLKKTPDSFLRWNKYLKKLSLPNVETAGYNFLYNNACLTDLDMPNLKTVHNYALTSNECLTELNLPKLEWVEDNFLGNNNVITELNLPNLNEVGNNFLLRNKVISKVNLPKLERVGNCFMLHNTQIKSLDLPSLEVVGNRFFNYNEIMSEANLPKLETVGDDFMFCNKIIEKINLSNLKTVGDDFLYYNISIEKLDLPNLVTVGRNFFGKNGRIEKLDLPNLVKTGNDFLFNNERISKINMPSLNKAGSNFLFNNRRLTQLDLPWLEVVGNNFMQENRAIKDVNLPRLTEAGKNFLAGNQSLLRKKKLMKNITILPTEEIEL